MPTESQYLGATAVSSHGEGDLPDRSNTNWKTWSNPTNVQGSTTSTTTSALIDTTTEWGTEWLIAPVDNYTLSGAVSVNSVRARMYGHYAGAGQTSGNMWVRFSDDNGTNYCSGHSLNSLTTTPSLKGYSASCTHFSWTTSSVDSMKVAIDGGGGSSSLTIRNHIAYLEVEVNYNTATAPPAPPTPTITGLGTNGGDASGKFTVNLLDDNGNGGSAFTNVVIEIDTVTSFDSGNYQSWNATTGIGDESHEFTGCLNGTSASPSRVTYYARGRYDNAIGQGAWSGNASTQTYTYPSAPSTGSFNTIGSTGGDNGGTVNSSVTQPDNGGTAMTSVTIQIDDRSNFDNLNGRRQEKVDATPSAPQTDSWTGMRYNTTYYLRAVFTNAVGQGQYNASSLANTTMWDYPPQALAPANTQIPMNVDQMTVSNNQPAGMDGSRQDLRFQVDTDSGFGSPEQDWTKGSVPSSPDNHTFTSLTKNTNYYSRALWKNEVGWSPTWSPASTVHLVKGVPNAPTLDTLVNIEETTIDYTFTHDANDGGSPVTAIKLDINGGGYNSKDGTSPNQETGLTAGTQYTFTIKSVNAYGDSLASNSIAKYTKTTAPTITNFQLYGKHGGVIVFTTPTGATSFNLEQNKDGAGFTDLINGILLSPYNFTHNATDSVAMRIVGVNPDGLEGTMSSASATFNLPELHHMIDPYQIIYTDPLMKVVRVKLTGGENQVDSFDTTTVQGDSDFVFDLIMEAGKKAVTIIPIGHNDTRRAVGLLATLYGTTALDLAIHGFEDVSFGEVGGSTVTPTIVPLILTLNRGNQMLIGFGSNNFYDMYSVVESNNEFLEAFAMSNIQDENEDIVYTWFANRYEHPNGDELQIFYEAENDTTGGSGTTALATASGGSYKYTSGTTITLDMGLLKKGSYMLLAYLNGNIATTTAQWIIKKDGTKIESYGLNIGSSETFTVDHTQWVLHKMPFVVDDETVSYTSDILQMGNITWVDFLILIPITNGKDFVMDLYQQGLSLSNNKYIGEV